MARPHAVVDTTLPLRLQLIVHRVAILTTEPQAVTREAEVEHAVAVAKRLARDNPLAQGAPVSQVEVQADPARQRGMPGHGAGRFERRHVGHGGGGTDDPGLKRREDHRVLVRAEAEIVSVDYDLARHVRPPG